MKTSRVFVLLVISLFILCPLFSGFATGKNPHITPEPTEPPTPEPTEVPTEAPTPEPTITPTETPTPEPTIPPTDTPTPEPTVSPTESPTPTLSPEPTISPSETPTPTISPEPTVTTPTPAPVPGGGGGGSGGGFFFPSSTSDALSSEEFSCDMLGATLSSTDGEQKITMDLNVAGDAIDLYRDHIVFKNKGLQISIETEEVLNPVDNIVRGTVKKATITTDPIIGEIKEKSAKFLVRVEATYPQAPPPGSSIRVTLGEAPEGDVLKSYQDGAQQQGFAIRRFAYTMHVHTQNLDSPPAATIFMSVSPEWVTTSGRNTVRILRVADDGTTEILETENAGYDQFGNNLFVADSPHGFSTFGLISVLQVSEPLSTSISSPVAETSISTPPPTTIAPLLPVGPSTTALPVPWFFAPALILVLISVGMGYLYLISQMRNEG
jgi:hypothetical protein